jgi:hypothetical protein
MKFALIFLISFIALMFIAVYQHEKIHQRIFEDYGIESHIEYFRNFPDVTTVATVYNNSCTESCFQAHEMNESIGYPMIILISVLGMGLFLIIIILELNLESCNI